MIKMIRGFGLGGFFLLLLRETQVIVTALTFVSILYLRSIHSLWFGLGTLIATGTAKVLKKLIRQSRPIESNKSTYGMPSSHSSSISYFGVYLFLYYWLIGSLFREELISSRSGRTPAWISSDSSSLPSKILSPSSFGGDSKDFQEGLDHHRVQSEAMISYSIMNRLIGLSFIFGAGCVCWSRVKLGHHTPIQVIVGALIGGLIGWIWFGIWSGFRLPRSILTSTSPSMMMNNRNEHLSSDWVRFDGLGGSIESNFDQSVELLIEAWKMRDGGLVWDGLGRPLINFIGHKLLGFKDDLIANGLPDGAMIM